MLVNAFTVDLEDWFQGLTSTNPKVDQWPTFESRVVPMTVQLLGMLAQYNVKATFFVLGHVADHHPQLIEKIIDDGHEIGIHGYTHRFVSKMSADAFAVEIEKSIEAVRRISGQLPIGHRAPYFSMNATTPWAIEVLQSFGLQYDSSYFPTRNMLYGYPNAPRFPYRLPGTSLFEFPLSTVRVGGINWPIAGGFYLRMLPYLFFKWGIEQLHQQGEPAIIYLHPWELDLAQPAHPLTLREKVTHRGGRRLWHTNSTTYFLTFHLAHCVTCCQN